MEGQAGSIGWWVAFGDIDLVLVIAPRFEAARFEFLDEFDTELTGVSENYSFPRHSPESITWATAKSPAS